MDSNIAKSKSLALASVATTAMILMPLTIITKPAKRHLDAMLIQTGPGDSTWRDHELAARAAAARGDWHTYRMQYVQLDSILRGHAAVTLGLARAEARLGDT